MSIFPIFADESIYLNWANRIAHGDEHFFLSMYDGKTPLFILITIPIFSLVNNLLLSGRLISVFSILFLSIAVYFFISTKYTKTWGWLSVTSIIFSPYILFHSRLALMDALHSSTLLISIFCYDYSFFSVDYIKIKKNKFSIKYFSAILSGIFLALSFWSKTPALFLFPFPFIYFLLFERNKVGFVRSIISSGTTIFMILPLVFSKWFPFLFSRSRDFTYPIISIIKGEVGHIIPNIITLYSWVNAYQSWIFVIFFIFGIIYGIYQKNKLILLLLIAFCLYTLPIIILGKVIAPRYYFFSFIILNIISAYFVSQFHKYLSLFLVLIYFLFNLNFYKTLLTNPINLDLPKADLHQYLIEWSSGIGIKSASEKVAQQAKTEKVILLTEGYFGTLPDGVFVSLADKNIPNLEIIGVGNASSSDFKKTIIKTKAQKIFYLGNQNRIDDQQRTYLIEEEAYPKRQEGKDLQLYQVDKKLYLDFSQKNKI